MNTPKVLFFAFFIVGTTPDLALGQKRVITFDGVPPPSQITFLSTEYQARGVTFGSNPASNSARSAIIDDVNTFHFGPAHSGTQVATIEQGRCLFSEGRLNEAWVRFTDQRHHVELFAKDGRPTAPYQVRIEGWAAGANLSTGQPLVVSIQTVNSGSWTLISIDRPQGDIAFVRIAAQGNDSACTLIDDLGFDVPAVSTADFGLSFFSTGAGVSPGHSNSVTVLLNRFGGSLGPIALSIGGLPSDITAQIAPQVPGGSALTTNLTLTFAASQNASALIGAPIILTGIAQVPGAGDPSKPRSVTIPLTVAANYTILAKTIEVTQGIQTLALPTRDTANSSIGTLSHPIVYSGVPLQQGRQTVARVLGDATFAGDVFGFHAELSGFDANMQELPGSPLLPDRPPVLTGANVLSAAIPYAQRTGSNDIEFTLPPTWTSGTITLRAAITPPGQMSFDVPTAEACDTPDCLNFREIAMSGITFSGVDSETIAVVHANLEGNLPPPPPIVFGPAFSLTPVDLHVTSYLGDIEMIDIFNSGESRNDMNSDALDRIEDWAEDNGNAGNMVIGVTSGIAPNPPTPDPDLGMEKDGNMLSGLPLAVVDPARSLTSVAHELNHGLSRNHASFACGAADVDNNGPADHWPPDERGEIEGIGFDIGNRSVIAPTAPNAGVNGNAEWLDFMSYCISGTKGFNGNISDQSPNTTSPPKGPWISARGWTQVMTDYQFPPVQSGSTINPPLPTSAPAAASAGASQPALNLFMPDSVTPTLEITGYTSATGTTTLRRVRLSSRPEQSGPNESPYHLRGFNTDGKVLFDIPMAVQSVHVDPAAVTEDSRPFHRTAAHVDFISARVPSAPQVQTIEILLKGKMKVRRTRSPHPPEVKLLLPDSGANIGAQPTVAVRWSATDADSDPLTAKVDFSIDEGYTWRTIHTGPNRNEAMIDSSFLTRSEPGKARLRIRISDGFNEASAISEPLTALGAPPTAAILSPGTELRMPDDTALVVRGQGWDDSFHRLTGSALTWAVDGQPVGHGEILSIGGFAPGLRKVTLTTEDSLNRTGIATLIVSVFPVKPLFLQLKAPSVVRSSVHHIAVTASSSIKGSLTINDRTSSVDRTSSTVTVPIPPSDRPVVLKLSLSAFGETTSTELIIPRSR